MNDTIGVISLGCSKNLVDTERMMGMLLDAGFSFSPEPMQADILIVNTCGFILPAKQESIEAILEAASYKQKGKCKTLVVTGCLSERYRKELSDEMPEIDILIGVNEYEKLPSMLLGREWEAKDDRRILTTPQYSAYLRIADGCDNRCAYCAIPSIRGCFRSVPMEKLIDEAKRLADGGVSELTLIAQDTSSYGRDLYANPCLTTLMDSISGIDGLKWLRLLYTYPDTVTADMIKRMADNEKICNYLDMPIQHINDGILKRMNRRGTRRHIESVLDYIRANAPDFILRTTVMVGFPGETDKEFDELHSFLQDYRFDRLGTFMYSPEEGTQAYSLPDDVTDDVKRARLDTLMREQMAISRSRNEARVGSVTEALIEKVENGVARARTYAEAPEVDGIVKLDARKDYRPGMYTRIRLTRAGNYDMEGEGI